VTKDEDFHRLSVLHGARRRSSGSASGTARRTMLRVSSGLATARSFSYTGAGLGCQWPPTLSWTSPER
jgi:hypothetical protein